MSSSSSGFTNDWQVSSEYYLFEQVYNTNVLNGVEMGAKRSSKKSRDADWKVFKC